MSWEPSVLTSTALVISILTSWCWLSSSRLQRRIIFAFSILSAAAAALLIDPHRAWAQMHRSGYDLLFELRPHVLLINNFRMVLTVGAALWLAYRSWQTLWKPVPDLINIMGVDVPDPPDVSLAGIKSDSATLSWTPPSSHRPIQKYSIQVNGVHVGQTPGHETAITVTGLKPNHFYNVRVVAVGPNHFQAPSAVVRLQTYGKDGRPQMGNSRLPSSFDDFGCHNPAPSREGVTAEKAIPTVEAAPVLDGPSNSRELGVNASGQRRNTLNRRHSPSVASVDQAQYKSASGDGPEMTLDELNSRFEGIRNETEDISAQIVKEQVEFQQQEEELKKEKERKRQALKEKEEQTAQLKALVRTTMEQVRVAEKEKARKEQQLKEKESKKLRVREKIAKLEREIETMKKEREGFDIKKLELEKHRDTRMEELDKAIQGLQSDCTSLEAELKDKGKQLQDLKESRQHLPGSDDQAWVEQDVSLRRDWEMRRQHLHNQLVAEVKRGRQLSQYLAYLRDQIAAIQQQPAIANYYSHTESPSQEMDVSVAAQSSKRLSHNSNVLSPQTHFAAPGTSQPSVLSLGQQFFASSLFVNVGNEDKANEPQNEAELRAQGGPLSPNAHALLPSGIFDDAEGLDAKMKPPALLPEAASTMDEEPKSPASSGRSFPMFSSPHGSTQNLPFPAYNDLGDHRSINLQPSPAPPPAASHRLQNLFSTIHRSFGHKVTDDAGLALGSLKSSQSQSFPRGTDDHESSDAKRRISFSWMARNSEGDGALPGTSNANAHPRRLNVFANSASALFSGERGSPRPASIASSELPRPSTDSSSIWGAVGDGSSALKNRLWSPNDPRWSSRSGSRRPSIHGSPSALTTTLASADDEILDEDDLLNPQTSPSQVGVIGSRPPGPSKASISQRLNPAAPTFMANIFRKDKDKDKDKEMPTDRTKLKAKKEKAVEGKLKSREATTPSIELPPSLDDSPSDSRMSKDTFSVHTQTSVSESHESLALDAATVSSAASDVNSNSAKMRDPDNVVKKLFRKGSSSKFSLSSRLGKESSLFKKSPGSTTTSERNMSSEYRSSIGDMDDTGEGASHLGRSYDSITSSPSLVRSKSRDGRENKLSTWFTMRKKEKESPVKDKDGTEALDSQDEQ